MKTFRLAAVSLVAVPLIVLPYVSANDQPGRGFVFDQVQRGAIANSIEATGIVEAVETVEVGSEVSGLIAKVFVNYNDPVAAGQPVAELDRAGFAARVAEAHAALKVSKALAKVQQAALRLGRLPLGLSGRDRDLGPAQGGPLHVSEGP